MVPNNYNTYLSVENQLPQFIRDEDSYRTFVIFLEAYYDWLSTEYFFTNDQIEFNPFNVEDRAKNILNYIDIDRTLPEFQNFFFNTYLPNFPEDCLSDKRKLIRFSREFHQRKSTPASFKFLFKAIYDSDCETYETRDFVLVASDGKWTYSKSIKIKTLDLRFLDIAGYRVIGETSKTVAVVENSKIIGDKIEIFLSDILRDFSSGENIRIVDKNLRDVIIDGSNLTAKILSNVQKISIDPIQKGLNYSVGDPVVIYGGLNPDLLNPIGASAQISEITVGSIKLLKVTNPSQGFRLSPYSRVDFTGGGGSGASASVTFLDIYKPFPITNISIDKIFPYANTLLNATSYAFSNNSTANANTRLIDAFKNDSFLTYPLSEVSIISGGLNYSSSPSVNIVSEYYDENGSGNDLSKLGILGPIRIISGGTGYSLNDKLLFSDGSGAGAYANVSSIAANGAIESVEYVANYENNHIYPIGGMGYNVLPKVSVKSIGGSNAILSVSSVVGDGEQIEPIVSLIGAIQKIDVTASGEDYISTPLVSLRVQDLILYNIDPLDLPLYNKVIYQGTIENPTYTAFLNLIEKKTNEGLYLFRVYEYQGVIDSEEPFYIDKNESGDQYYEYNLESSYNSSPFLNGVRYYGDGRAKATVDVLFGITEYKGRYINSDSHLSSYSRLESEVYNNFTYFVNVEKAFIEYSSILYNIIHPAGSQALGKNLIKKHEELNVYNQESKLNKVENLRNSLFIQVNCAMKLESTNDFATNKVYFYGLDPYTIRKATGANTYIKVESNQLSLYNVDLILSEINGIILTPIKDSILYQGTSNNPTFYGKINTVSDLGEDYYGYKIYKFSLENCSGDLNLNEYIYSDSGTFGNKFYKYYIEKYNEYPFENGSRVIKNNDTFYSKFNQVVSDIDNIIELDDYKILKYSNVAYGYSNSNSIIITSLTNKFDIINNGNYSNTNHLFDVVLRNDTILVSNNNILTVENIDYENKILYFNDVLNNSGNATHPKLVSVIRTFTANSVYLYYQNFDKAYLRDYASISIDIDGDAQLLTDTSNNIITIPYTILEG